MARIDDSPLGTSVTKQIVGRPIADLAATHSLIGVLTSDGLTTTNSEWKLVGCGEVINVPLVADTGTAGGGRTQAVLAASTFGTAIKVSEDGPLSAFKGGRETLLL